MTDAERERLLTHGGTARAAVTKLLDLADEHATCEPPRRRSKPPAAQPPMRLETLPPTSRQSMKQLDPTSTVQQGDRVYEVIVAGRTTLSTTSKARAEKAAKQARERYPRRTVEVR